MLMFIRLEWHGEFSEGEGQQIVWEIEFELP